MHKKLTLEILWRSGLISSESDRPREICMTLFEPRKNLGKITLHDKHTHHIVESMTYKFQRICPLNNYIAALVQVS